jgi:hypothetical protein
VLCVSRDAVAPGEGCHAVLIPLHQPAWMDLKIGDQVYLYEGPRLCGQAEVLIVVETPLPLSTDAERVWAAWARAMEPR